MGKKKAKTYVLENLKHFATTLQQMRTNRYGKNVPFRVDIDGLQKAIKSLPRTDRENIERYWGLTGGLNHSKIPFNDKNIALSKMRFASIASINTLFRLDYMLLYNGHLQNVISSLGKKINKNGIQISDLDASKYLLVFLVFLHNGPKMCFEDDPLSIYPESKNLLGYYDEYSIICALATELSEFPDNYVNLKLLIHWLEMFDFKDTLAIKNKFMIETHSEYSSQEIQNITTFSQLRKFKEKIFPYGAWKITGELILGNMDGKVELKHFMESLSTFCRDWSKVEDFKSGQVKLKTSNGIRTLNVYNIGGKEFTDIYEIMFLYLERDLITA